MQMNPSPPKLHQGFTLVELAVVVVIIGILAAFGVPRFLQSVEQARAAEAFSYLSAVRTAQERYHAREGSYAETLSKLDIQAPTPRYFTMGDLSGNPDLKDSWTLTLTRSDSSTGYGPYTVTFTDEGYDAIRSRIAAGISPISVSGRSGG